MGGRAVAGAGGATGAGLQIEVKFLPITFFIVFPAPS